MESGVGMWVVLAAVFVVAITALAGVWLLTPPVLTICRRFSIFDFPSARKRHLVPTPRLGGLAIIGGIALAFGAAMLGWPEMLADINPQWPGIVWATVLILALGLYDDLVGAPPHVKLATQVLAALLLCLWDFRFNTIYVPFVGALNLGFWSVPLTVAWVVVITNAINLIDGMDGLAAGVAAIGAGFLTMVGIFWHVPYVAVLGAALLGATAGFLRFNYPPAQLFMGDSGSLTLGFLFAVASVSVPIKTLTVVTMAVPLLAVAIPLVEVFNSFTRRLAAGRSPLRADRLHWHHLLLRRGWSVKRVLWTFYAVAFGFGLFVPALRVLDRYYVMPVFVVFCAVVFGYLTRHTSTRNVTYQSESTVEHARV
jgi:UDP-GlcNAc:undecaprenyl-phosphate GlcNAc-1-phosphate transferase